MTTPLISRGRILLADDDPAFLTSTAELLRGEGYEVDPVADGTAALARVSEGADDLMIAEPRLVGGEALTLVQAVVERGDGIPVIIVTDHPSTASAIASVDLQVAAYLPKPIDSAKLLSRIDRAVSKHRAQQAMRRANERLAKWREESEEIVSRTNDDVARDSGAHAFLELTLRNVMESLSDLEHLGHALSGREQQPHACQLVNCPRGLQLNAALGETIAVLEETKSSFKSKSLATLRRKLELLRAYS